MVSRQKSRYGRDFFNHLLFLLNECTLENIKIMKKLLVYTSIIMLCVAALRPSTERERQIMAFNEGWRFHLGDVPQAEGTTFDDSGWRELTIPHDWSIEGEFSEQHPATAGGGALPGGIGWYRKSFTLPEEEKGKLVFIDFDGG